MPSDGSNLAAARSGSRARIDPDSGGYMIRIALTLLVLSAPGVRAQELSCETECIPLIRETLAWVTEKYGVAPGELVLDSVMSGRGRQAAGNPQLISKAVFENIAASSGLTLGQAQSVLDCSVPIPFPPGTTCRFLRGSALANIRVMELGLGSVVLKASVTVVHPEKRLSYTETYQLTLERGAEEWQVVDSLLVMAT